MSCIANQKKFLLFKWEGQHKLQIVRFGRFMEGSKHFIVLIECSLCGIQEKRNFVTEGELLKMGVPIAVIKEHRSTIF